MDFKPYQDELQIINRIHKFNNSEYTMIRLTKTMIDKNIIDANAFVRDLLSKYSLVDYTQLQWGGQNKIKLTGNLILNNESIKINMSFYRANTRGDERFAIYGINKLIKNTYLNIDDLIYITVNTKKSEPTITLINVTHNLPKDEILSKEFGHDALEDALNRLIPVASSIARQGFHPNLKGIGKIAPKDAGDTFEALLDIKTNNSKKADFEDLIELKSKTSKTLNTLFTLRPHFENTPIADFESNDRNRVSAFARLYGYDSEKHPGYKSLYITIGSENAPQNKQGFYLFVNEDERTIELKRIENNKSIVTAFWTFDELKKELYEKHPATLWVKVESRMNGNLAEFKYTEAELTRSPQFMTFISLIKTGSITYDWRGYTTPEGKYSGKNHGNAWRIKTKQRQLLFGSTEKIDLLSL
ncbi:MvaI/BcnI family restriction endonuclease [Lactococcus petauri]|uniref:MvaI/BcnI family restriction endonuclease n=1 Tax=Lactococcus petauri TaxID=1940789 RepID=UPI0038527193